MRRTRRVPSRHRKRHISVAGSRSRLRASVPASRTNRAPIIEEFGIQYPPIATLFTRVLGRQYAAFASRLVKPAIAIV